MIELEPGLAGAAYHDMAMSYYLKGELPEAITHLKEAIVLDKNQSRETLVEYGKRMMGETYLGFWEHADTPFISLCQNHCLLAGFYLKVGDTTAARENLNKVSEYLDQEELKPVRSGLIRELVRWSETEFSELAEEEIILRLSKEVGD